MTHEQAAELIQAVKAQTAALGAIEQAIREMKAPLSSRPQPPAPRKDGR